MCAEGPERGTSFKPSVDGAGEMLQLRPGLTHFNANVMLVEAQISELMRLFCLFGGSFTYQSAT